MDNLKDYMDVLRPAPVMLDLGGQVAWREACVKVRGGGVRREGRKGWERSKKLVLSS